MSAIENKLNHVNHVSMFGFGEAEVHSVEKRSNLHSRQQDNGDYSNVYYWPVGVVMGLAFSIPLLLILSIALCCTFSLQSEFKFDAELNALKKHK